VVAFPPKVFSGSYMRDDGVTYKYDVEVQPTMGRAVWFAKVRCVGEFRGAPNGVVPDLQFTSPKLEAAVRQCVETAIRDGVGVRTGINPKI
jgi:hypothetical protein